MYHKCQQNSIWNDEIFAGPCVQLHISRPESDGEAIVAGVRSGSWFPL